MSDRPSRSLGRRAADWVAAHRRSSFFLLGVLVLAGLATALRLPVSLFPTTTFPRIRVEIEAGDKPVERMVLEVTRPVEEAVRTVPDVAKIRSTSSRGAAEVAIDFAWGTDMVAAALQVEATLNRIRPDLPAETTFVVRRMDPTVFPVLALSLTSKSRSQVDLRNLAVYTLQPQLAGVAGVAAVLVLGGDEREFRLSIDPAALEAYALTLDDVANAIARNQAITALGRLEDRFRLYLVLGSATVPDLDALGRLVIRAGPSGVVRLEDLGKLEDSTAPRWNRVTANGEEAVLINVHQRPGGNTPRIASDIETLLDSLRDKLPAGVEIGTWYDQSELIVDSAASVRDAIGIGVLLAAVVLLIFLRSLRLTLVALVAVPATLATAVLALGVLHQSFNVMTLGGLAAAVGLVVDDAIVMVEHVVRRIRDAPHERGESVRLAATEFTVPLAGSSLATIVIFAPLAWLSGVTGAFFRALSLTMALSLAISFLIAWLVVPVIAGVLLTDRDTRHEAGGTITTRAHSIYSRLLAALLRIPALVLVVALLILAAGFLAWRSVGSGFLPPMDEGGFVLDYRAQPGTSLTETDRLLRQVEAILREMPEVSTWSRRTGLQLGGGVTEVNEGDFFVRLVAPGKRRPIDEVMDEVRGRVEHEVPGLEVEMAQLMEDLIGDLTAVPQPIEVKLYSDDLPALLETAPRVREALGRIPGVVDTAGGVVLAGDALVVEIDRLKAALEGLDPQTVIEQATAFTEGTVATRFPIQQRLVGARVWIPADARATPEALGRLRLRAPDGHPVALARVATITPVTGQPQIERENLRQMLSVTARISGRDLGSVAKDVERTLVEHRLVPASVGFRLGGLYAEQRTAFLGLLAVLAAAALLVFFLLLLLFESFRVAAAMMITSILALAAVLMGLWLTGTELDIASMMGLTMVVGIVTEVGIFFQTEYEAQPLSMAPAEALVAAGIGRMRPIAMTTFAAILALLPLALGLGQGSSMMRPLAIAIIAGLVSQLPLVLLVYPWLLALIRVPPGRRANH